MTAGAAGLARRALMVLWLLGVWTVLWGVWRFDVLLLGVLVALAAVHWSRLPAPPLRTRIQWRRLPRLLLWFAADVVRSAWDVARATVRTGRQTRSSVLELRLAPGASDMAVMLACNRITLEPGTIVIDLDRPHDRLFVYQLGTPDREAAESARAAAQHLLDEVMATFPARQTAGPVPQPDDEGETG